MDSQLNPGPRGPQEDLDEEIEHQHGVIINEEMFNIEEIILQLEMMKILLSVLQLCFYFHSIAHPEND